MNECIKPCHNCVPRCLPIDTPESHAEHALIDAELRKRATQPPSRGGNEEKA